MVYKVKVANDHGVLLVCDVMKSLTIYAFTSNKFEVRARYPNGQWCFEAVSLTDPTGPDSIADRAYLSCDFNKNLVYLTQPADAGANLLEI